MDSVGDVLSKYHAQGPDEIAAIKHYIHDTFQAESNVAIHNNTLIITVYSASLANALRLRIVDLKNTVATDKRITFRIG